MQEKFKVILEKIVLDFESVQRVSGLLLFGSLARGREHINSDIDLMVIAKETKDKTTTKEYGNTMVQCLWRTEEDFRMKASKKTRFIPASKHYKVLLDKENWIEDFLKSENVRRTWKEPLPLGEREKLLMSTEFSSSIDTLNGLACQGKNLELHLFLYDYIYLGLELLYDINKWFLETKKYIISDIKMKNPEVWGLINAIYNARKEKILVSYEHYYHYIMEIIGNVPKEYTIYW